jgi:CRISPR-associated protein Csy3
MALKTASVLAFERKLNASDALFYSGTWNDRNKSTSWPSLSITEKAVRGTISNRLKNAITSDPAKLDNEVQKANLQTVDAAALPSDADTLKVVFTLRVLSGISQPSVCNNADYQKKLSETIERYLEEHECRELAYRYACNLANGRFLWRNRIGAEQIEVHINTPQNESTVFNAYEFSLNEFPVAENSRKKIAAYIQKGLVDSEYCLLTITAFVKLGRGQEVYPSQELIQDKVKSKYLYQVNGIAAMHSQKISNAVRTIDTWHSEADTVGPIAVEPYGSVTSRGAAYRQPKLDFYTLFDNWVLKDKAPDLEQQHYVVATLIRGGVFGEAG